MSKYKAGTGSKLQAGAQLTWGTSVSPDTLINMTSEGINFTINKEAEGSLLGTKTETSRDLVSKRVDGSVSTILKPEFADFVFKQAMGVVESGTNLKTYTLANPGVDLPLSTFVLRRGGEEAATSELPANWNVRTYPDITITSLSIEAPAQQYVTAELNIVGSKELKANETGAKTLADLDFTKGSYRCVNATLYYGDDGDITLNKELSVESTTITIDNGVSESPATYASGYYADQPVMGQRTVTVNFTIPYGTDAEYFKRTYYEADAEVALKLRFDAKDSSDEYIEIYLPKVSLTNGSGNVGGADLIDCSFEGVALTPAATTVEANPEPIRVTVHHQATQTV